jgi:hypothetical protein
MSENFRSFRELRVFQTAFETAMEYISPRRRVTASPRQED